MRAGDLHGAGIDITWRFEPDRINGRTLRMIEQNGRQRLTMKEGDLLTDLSINGDVEFLSIGRLH